MANLLEQLKKCGPKYDVADGWYVLSYGIFWYVGLIIDGYVQRSKKIGKFRTRGTNYFDRACQVCNERNTKDGYTFELNTYYHIPVQTMD